MMSPLLETLRSTSPLPDGWSELEVVEDIVVVDGVQVHRAGIASIGPSGEEVTGSAAEAASSPLPRSYYELLERAATLEALRNKRSSYEVRSIDGVAAGTCSARDLFPESDEPSRWRYARSNGVAVHRDWSTAASRAFWELAERDRVLRSWYGESAPQRLSWDVSATPLARSQSYQWRIYEFPETDVSSFAKQIAVVGVFGFPTQPDAPLVLGFGARPQLEAAVDAAVTEALQLLAFLWGEALPGAAPPPAPSPDHHLEHFQYPGHHASLREWLDGAHLAFRGNRRVEVRPSRVSFVDLTPGWLTGGYRVAKAFAPRATPLTFGDPPFAVHLPARLRVHPIA